MTQKRPLQRITTQFLVLAGVAFICWAGAAPAESNLTKSYSVQPGGFACLDADRGSIDVVTTDKPEVSIEVRRSISGLSTGAAQKVFDAHEVTFNQENNRVTVRARFHDGARMWNRDRNKLQVRYSLSVPKQCNLDLNTAGGNIRIAEIEGTVKARTAGGNLDLAGVTGSVDGQTAGGNIDLSRATGEARVKTSGGNIALGEMASRTWAETSGGNISVEQAKAELTVKTSGGDIRINQAVGTTRAETAGGQVRVQTGEGPLDLRTSGGSISVAAAHDAVNAHTSAGDIKLALVAQPRADCQLSTSGGNIRVQIPPNAALTLDARASGGHVECRVPITATISTKERDHLVGKINGGGSSLVLKTSAGDVIVESR